MNIGKLLVCLVIAVFFLSGCMPNSGASSIPTSIATNTFVPKTNLPGDPVPWNELVFYNEGQANTKASREEDQPRLSVITRPEEIGAVEEWIKAYHLPFVQNVDYNQSLVLIIFSGYRGETQQGIEILQIVKAGGQVTLSVEFTKPPDGEARGPLITSPYRMIEINRKTLPENPEFILIANGKQIDPVSPD